ncbi:MAG: hypothetical protein JST46_00300 [Bacteroidetes bacterium]|nr:hypothetical protein [Bacteroidota bacterium]
MSFMHKRIYLIGAVLAVFLVPTGCMQKLYNMKQSKVVSEFEQMDFHGLAKLYMSKGAPNPIEGIYSVSGEVIRKGGGFLSSSNKEKVLDRRENYAQVAIIRDPDNKDREFIEVSLDKEGKFSYSVVGEFTTSAGGSLLIYKHLESKDKVSSFTFTFDQKTDVLEGIRTDSRNNASYTYKLTYVKLYPK